MTTLVHYMYRPAYKSLVEVGGKRMMANVLASPRGVLVAYQSEEAPGYYLVGVSLCHPGDQFNKKDGVALAKSKAITWWMRGHTPKFLSGCMNREWFKKELAYFKARCDKAFNGAKCSLDYLERT
jgi:hypothetical protein